MQPLQPACVALACIIVCEVGRQEPIAGPYELAKDVFPTI